MSQHLQEDRGAATSPDIWYTVATGAENIYMFYRGSYSVFNFFAIFLLVLSREWGNDPQQLIINNSASNPQQPIHSLLSTTKMIGLEYIDIWYTVATGAENMYIYMYNYIYNYIYIYVLCFFYRGSYAVFNFFPPYSYLCLVGNEGMIRNNYQ